jgi:Domain of unknown function (DUF4345)
MPHSAALSASQHIARIGLLLFAAIAIFGGTLQMYLGQPDTSPRLDNVHRFMAGIYLGTGLICLWAGLTIRTQGVLDRGPRTGGATPLITGSRRRRRRVSLVKSRCPCHGAAIQMPRIRKETS